MMHSPKSWGSAFTILPLFIAMQCAAGAAQAQTPAVAETGAASAARLPTPLVRPVPRPVVPTSPVVTLGTDIEWRALSPQQQQFLSALEQQWNGLDSSHKGKWLELAARYPSMPAQEQALAQERMAAWAKLSPAERQRARIAYQAAQQVKPSDRQAKWEAYQALPAERRQELLDKAAQKRAAPVASPTSVAPLPLTPPSSGKAAIAPVAPAVLQVKPGATTVPLSAARPPVPAGKSRLAANMGELDAHTLLPRPAASGAANKP